MAQTTEESSPDKSEKPQTKKTFRQIRMEGKKRMTKDLKKESGAK